MASASTPLRQPAAPPLDPPEVPEDLDELRALIQEGIDDLEAGRSVDGETFMKEWREKAERRAAANRAGR